MPLISQSVDGLNEGVSRQPHPIRSPGQLQEQSNAIGSTSRGLGKRPPTVHVSKLLGTTGNENVFMHPILRGDSERYVVAVVGGAVKVFNSDTGVEYTVVTRGTVSYVTGASTLRAVTIGDTTLLVNPATVVTTLARTSPALRREALIIVKAVESATTYSITVDSKTVSVPSALGSAQWVATELVTKLTAALSGYTITRVGAVIHLTRTSGALFRVSGSDGLGSNAVQVIQGSVQHFEDLPAYAKAGMVVEVVGNATSAFDNYWVTYDQAQTADGEGVWRETVRPGTVVALNPQTMPHKLTLGGSYIQPEAVCKQIPTASTAIREIATDLTKDSFDHYNGAVATSTLDITLWRDGDYVERTLAAGANNAKIQYTISTMSLNTGAVAYVTAWKNGSVVAQKEYSAGLYSDQEELVIGTVISTDVLRLTFDYGQGDTPDSEYNQASVIVGGSTRDRPGIALYGYNAQLITFEARNTYPKGYAVTATISGTPRVYTTSADETGETVATGLKAVLVAAGYTCTTPEVGQIGVATTNTITLTTNCDNGLAAWIENADFSSSLAALTVRNLSDSSTGTISSSAGSLIFATSMSGGTANKFQAGHKIDVIGAGTYFVLSQAQWTDREVGDLTSNPWPSFVGRKIAAAFACQGRLGFIAGDSVVASQTGNTFNFFRQTATDLLPDDLIDVKSAINLPSDFHGVFSWQEKIVLASDAGYFTFTGEPVLTPMSARIDPLIEVPNARGVLPVIAGSHLFFARNRTSEDGQVLEMIKGFNDEAPDIHDTTGSCPGYLPGAVLQLTGDGSFGFIAARMADDRSSLYVYLYRYREDGARLQSAWSCWTFLYSSIISVLATNGTLTLAFQRPDGVFLERIDLISALAFDP